MKIVVTGSLGNISKPLTEILLDHNHDVTVISSNPERIPAIKSMGANPAIGSMTDAVFLTETFTGADIVYCMETLGHDFFFDKELDYEVALMQIGNNYKEAIEKSGVKDVIHLSSIGAHTNRDVGMLSFHHDIENIFDQLPEDIIIKFMRPVGFYYNTLAFIPVIKATGSIIQNYGGDEREPWVSTADIATVIAEEMELPFDRRSVRYIASEELSPNEVATILGEAIHKPDLKWITIPDDQMLGNLIAASMNPSVAKGMVEMNAARRNGILYEDYNQYKPLLGRTKMSAFAKTFAEAYNNS